MNHIGSLNQSVPYKPSSLTGYGRLNLNKDLIAQSSLPFCNRRGTCLSFFDLFSRIPIGYIAGITDENGFNLSMICGFKCIFVTPSYVRGPFFDHLSHSLVKKCHYSSMPWVELEALHPQLLNSVHDDPIAPGLLRCFDTDAPFLMVG